MHGPITLSGKKYAHSKLYALYLQVLKYIYCDNRTPFEYDCTYVSILILTIGYKTCVPKVLLVNLDPANGHDCFAMAVLKAGAVIGHVPRKVSWIFHFFLIRCGKIMCEGTGCRKLDKAPEVYIPCIYKFTGIENKG